MIKYNKQTHLLLEDTYKYELQNVKKPNYFREMFDYDSVPKTSFNFRQTPMDFHRDVVITDTTFRDGQQSTSPYSVKQIVDIFKMLSKLSGPKGIIRQSEFFVYSEKDKEAVRKCKELGLDFPEITAWIRANEKDFEIVKEMEIKETGILVSCSDFHIFKKMGLDRKKALDKYLAIVKMALEKNIVPRCHFEDITRADFYGFVVPFALELMKLSKESGIPIKIRACDTLGFGVSYPGTSLPRSVQGIIYGLRHYAEVPSKQLEWHGHNDFYKVVTNAATAWLYGCGAVNCSLLGIGERTGNCPLEAMVMEYVSLHGTTDGMDLSVITDIAEYFEKEIEYAIPPRTPFVGRAFNSTRAGIHADGMLKDPEIYNIFNTEKILKRKPMVAIDKHSGIAGLAYWINEYYDLLEEDRIPKTHPVLKAMKDVIDKEYEEGRNTVMGDDELEAILHNVDSKFFKHILALSEKLL